MPREGNGDPALLGIDRLAHRIHRAHALQHRRQPGATGRRIPEGKEFVAAGHRRGARQQNMLDVVELEHAARYCIWSSICDSAALTRSAFLISSAVAYGYSPYSRKLGHWCSRTNLTKAGALVFQSFGNPSRFSNTVLMPVAPNSATASSVYLSKSVSKIPWYMK